MTRRTAMASGILVATLAAIGVTERARLVDPSGLSAATPRIDGPLVVFAGIRLLPHHAVAVAVAARPPERAADRDADDDWLHPTPTAFVSPGARVLSSMVAYGRQYDEVLSPSGVPEWEVDGAATEQIADSDGERATLYDALTTRPLSLAEMEAAQSYGSTLNAPPVTTLAPADQANALRAAWSQQSSLQWLNGQKAIAP